MAWIIRMPKLGQTMEAGVIQQWLKQEGDDVEAGEPIAIIESEKFTGDIEARESGVLRKILLAEGEEAPPGTPIGIVAEAREALPEIDVPARAAAGAPAAAAVETAAPPAEAAPARRRKVKASPAAKKLAREIGVDLSCIEATGLQGSITKEDVERSRAQRQADAEPRPARTPLETRDLTPMRRTIAARLGQSYREAVHVTLNKMIDLSRLMELRQQLNAQSDAESGVNQSATNQSGANARSKLSVIDFIIAAVVKALEQHPELNAVFENERHILIKEKNIGLAVDIGRGLLTIVLHGAEELNIFQLSTQRGELTQKALNGKYTAADLAGGTFTITNLGPYGIDSFTPIINPPEIAILGLGRIQQQAVQAEQGQITFAPQMTFSLSFDHRIVDGGAAARFLGSLEKQLTQSEGLVPDQS